MSLKVGGSTAQVLAADGATAAPSIAFAAQPTTGFWRRSGGEVVYVAAGTGALDMRATYMSIPANSTWSFTNAAGDAATTLDTSIGRIGAGQISISNTLNGHSLNPGLLFTELLTIAAAATTDSATNIPAGAVVLGVSVRVTTVIPTAATFTMIGATTSTVFQTAAVTVAAGSTDAGTAAGAFYNAAAQKVRITPNVTPGAATGVVRLAVYGYQITPPTS